MDYFPSERHLENAIWQSAKDTNVNPIDGSRLQGILRQPRMGSLGVCDMAFINAEADGLHLQLVELKNKKMTVHHIAQAARYLMFANLHIRTKEIRSVKATLVSQRTEITDDMYWLAYASGVELVCFDFDNGLLVFDDLYIEEPDYKASKKSMDLILLSMGVHNVR